MSFTSVLKKIGQDIAKVFSSNIFQTGEKIAVGALDLAFPAMGPLFNTTAQAVMTAEANFAAVGKSSGTGAQKLAAVVTNAGNLIEQGLKDAGVANVTQSTVENYISAVVTILNATPAPATTTASA
jgi:hypothetical protein